jgi:hypothetical protein
MPERPAFAAMDGASKTPGSSTSCVWGGAAKYFTPATKSHIPPSSIDGRKRQGSSSSPRRTLRCIASR